MTIGTAIVVSIGILCATFLGVMIIGAVLEAKKTKATKTLSDELKNQITSGIKHIISK